MPRPRWPLRLLPRPFRALTLVPLSGLFVIAVLVAGCGADDESVQESDADDAAVVDQDQAVEEPDVDQPETVDAVDEDDGLFPRQVETAVGPVTVEARPQRIISLSPTATEILFAIGAGDRVVAVDRNSDHPPEAPQGTLDGFAPDLAELLSLEADLIVTSGLPGEVSDGLADAGVTVIVQPVAASFDDTYNQVAQLGEATGMLDEAAATAEEIRAGIDAVLASLPTEGEPVRVFHEIDDSFYTTTSSSFIGQVYAAMGFENIADPLDDGTGFPLLDADSIIAADPTLIVFTSQAGITIDEIAARPGWSAITAVARNDIVEVDADIASRWGPRIVEFMEAVAATVGAES